MVARLDPRPQRPLTPLGRFADRLLQSFENVRHGVSDETLRSGSDAVTKYFMEHYAREESRLLEAIHEQPISSEVAKMRLHDEVDSILRKVLIPGYVRLATSYTARERNEFYLIRAHGLERIAWGAAGILLGLFVVAAPFIPLWSKEWVFVFMIGGLLFPNIRAFWWSRRYERELNRLVDAADDEFRRIDVAYVVNDIAGSVDSSFEDTQQETIKRALNERRGAQDKENG